MNKDNSIGIFCQKCFKTRSSEEFPSEDSIVCCECESSEQKEQAWTCFECNCKIQENSFYCPKCLNDLDDERIRTEIAFKRLDSKYSKILKIEERMKGK